MMFQSPGILASRRIAAVTLGQFSAQVPSRLSSAYGVLLNVPPQRKTQRFSKFTARTSTNHDVFFGAASAFPSRLNQNSGLTKVERFARRYSATTPWK